MEPEDPAASDDHAEKNQPVDFFDFLTRHRSPPLHEKSITLLPKVKTSSELSIAKCSNRQADEERSEESAVVSDDNSHIHRHTQAQTQSQNAGANESCTVHITENDTRKDNVESQFCSPVRKRRKDNAGIETHEVVTHSIFNVPLPFLVIVCGIFLSFVPQDMG